MKVNNRAVTLLMIGLFLSVSLCDATDNETYNEKYEALVQLYRLGHAAFLYAPYPIARDALAELAVAQEEFVRFVRDLPPAPGDGTLSVRHLEFIIGDVLENTAVDYYRLYLIEEENGNPSQAQYFLDRALSTMGGQQYEDYLATRAMASYQPQNSRLEDICRREFERAIRSIEHPEPIRVYRPEPDFGIRLSNLEPPALPQDHIEHKSSIGGDGEEHQ